MEAVSTWGGHAAIYIEMVEIDQYSMLRAHLTTEGIRLDQLKTFNPSRIASKSVTWIRPRKTVERMLSRIKWQILEQEKGQQPVCLDMRGRGSIGVSRDSSINAQNCLDYAFDSLKYARCFKKKKEDSKR